MAIDRPMDQIAYLLGFGRVRAVWRFGWPPASLEARAFGVYTETPWYVLALHGGRVMAVHRLGWDRPLSELPQTFQNVLAATL